MVYKVKHICLRTKSYEQTMTNSKVSRALNAFTCTLNFLQRQTMKTCFSKSNYAYSKHPVFFSTLFSCTLLTLPAIRPCRSLTLTTHLNKQKLWEDILFFPWPHGAAVNRATCGANRIAFPSLFNLPFLLKKCCQREQTVTRGLIDWGESICGKSQWIISTLSWLRSACTCDILKVYEGTVLFKSSASPGQG